jgi:hypothetical protein
MNITEQLRQLAEQGLEALRQDRPESLPALAGQAEQLALQIEGFFKSWDAPPPGLEDMVDEMDQTYLESGDLYLEACELIEDGSREGREDLFVQAQEKLNEAAAMLQAAAAFAQSMMMGEAEG